MYLTGASPLLALAVVLVAGVLSGALARRLRLPAVTGQIVIGILLGHSVLDIFTRETMQELTPITHFALGLIAVTIGDHLNFRRLRNAFKRLSILLLFEITLLPCLVTLSLVFVPGTTWELSVLLAALCISTAPATIVAIVRETRSKGLFVKTLMAAVALNNIGCICIFAMAHHAAGASMAARMDPDAGYSLAMTLIAPFRQLIVSAAIGGAVGWLLIFTTKHVVRPDRLATFSLIAILLTSGLADYAGFSSLLACLFLGVTLANGTPDRGEVGHVVFADFEYAFFAVFFTMAGMELDFHYVVSGGLLAILMFGTRLVLKVGGARIAMTLAKAPARVAQNLGLALVPQAGLAVGLMLLVEEDHRLDPIRQIFLAAGLTVVIANEILGPILTRMALHRAGEVGKDRPRLIDFIHEENIITDFDVETKEEGIERLVDLLISSHHLSIDREKLKKSILDREEQASTCIGEGLAIPHGIIEEGEKMYGVIGISHRGLRFDTPDGVPVHCMVLLATPEAQRALHLEVLAALARSIGSDRNIQRQLYHAESPAHAYEIIHAEEFEDYNYFLEDERQGS
ncbi:MAG: PTS sugar transporter subunit IIA [Planctomycetota bacterium]|nr:PTS sugar transporter subunit IIA [Planctomycetota bacterium]